MKNIFIFLTIVIFISACSKSSNLEINLEQSELFLAKNLLNSKALEFNKFFARNNSLCSKFISRFEDLLHAEIKITIVKKINIFFIF